jgi:hypothetical protein
MLPLSRLIDYCASVQMRSAKAQIEVHVSTAYLHREGARTHRGALVLEIGMTPIDLYTYWPPNGHKASIMLEETGLPYKVHVIDIDAGDQHRPEFLALNPNNKVPVITDADRNRTVGHRSTRCPSSASHLHPT